VAKHLVPLQAKQAEKSLVGSDHFALGGIVDQDGGWAVLERDCGEKVLVLHVQSIVLLNTSEEAPLQTCTDNEQTGVEITSRR